MFLRGFYELVPREDISIFNYKELELLIAGLPDFDLDDLKANIDFRGYNIESPQIVWFFEIIETFTKSEMALLLQFVTGSSQIPLDGFKSLQGMNGQ
jgi:E3 ubiquitin-protein ligase HUWE1